MAVKARARPVIHASCTARRKANYGLVNYRFCVTEDWGVPRMLGMVFTEFVDLIEQRFGIEVLDQVIQGSHLGHEAAYTAVGYYPFSELQKLLATLCRQTGAAPDVLLRAFGHHLFMRLRDGHPQFFADPALDLFGLLHRLDAVVHVEVRKLYSEAKLPRFQCAPTANGGLRLEYASDRGLADLALGLIEGAALHFGEKVDITHTDTEADGIHRSVFLLTRVVH